jgi:hypothetical protein
MTAPESVPQDDADVQNEPSDLESEDFVDDPSIPDDPRQEAPGTDNALRPEDGPQAIAPEPEGGER